MIFLLYGADAYRSKKQREKFIAEFKSRRDPQGLNICVFHGAAATVEEILASASAAPFLGEKRLTVALAFSENKDASSHERVLAALEGGVVPDSSVMLFWEPQDFEKTSSPLFAFLMKQKYSQQFNPLSAENAEGWLQEEAKKHSLSIDSAAARELTGIIGADMHALELELAKCASLARAEEKQIIDTSTLHALYAPPFDDNMFHCIDAALMGRTGDALRLLHEQWASGNSEQEVFGALIWQMRVLLEAKDFMERHGARALSDARSTLGIHPFVIKKITPLLMRAPHRMLASAYAELLRIDDDVKSGIRDFRLALDQFVIAFSERVRA